MEKNYGQILQQTGYDQIFYKTQVLDGKKIGDKDI
jgi:hypothetical protein